MVSEKTNHVFIGVGILIIIILIMGFVAMAGIAREPARTTMVTSEGKAFGGPSCSNSQVQQPAECNPAKCGGCREKSECGKTCRNAPTSCQRG